METELVMFIGPWTVPPIAQEISRVFGRDLSQQRVTGAIRADRPELAVFDFSAGYARFAPTTRPREHSPYYARIYFSTTVSIPLPLPGHPAQELDLARAGWEADGDGASGFVIEWLRIDLYSKRNPGVPTECRMIGDASVVYLPVGSE